MTYVPRHARRFHPPALTVIPAKAGIQQAIHIWPLADGYARKHVRERRFDLTDSTCTSSI